MARQKRSFRELDRHGRINIILYILVSASFTFPIVFLAIRMITGRLNIAQDAGANSFSSYVLMMLQCALGLLVINVPSMLAKRFKFELPVVLYSLYIVFLYCAIFLGEVTSFYYVIPIWDSILHAFSSVLLGLFGLMVVSILNHDENIVVHLSPFFVVLFSFCFAVTFGTLWEIYEYTFDGLLGLNMQKFITADGTVLSGHAALSDTMKDIIIDCCGALIASIAGYFSIKSNRFWFIPKLTKDDNH